MNYSKSFRANMTLLFFAGAFTALSTLTSTSVVNANTPEDRTLPAVCELEDSTVEMREELKIHFRRVRGYGLMLGTNAQIKGRVLAIGRRFKRDPYYRGLDRDVTRVEELSIRLGELIQAAIDCPERLERAEGDARHVVARANQILDLSESLRISVGPYCTVAVETGYRGYVADPVFAEPEYYRERTGYRCPQARPCPLRTPLRGPADFQENEMFPRPAIPATDSFGNPIDPYSPYPFDPGTQVQPNYEMAPGIPRSSLPPMNATPRSNNSSGADRVPAIQPTPSLIAPEPSLGTPIEAQGSRLPTPVLIAPAPSMKSVLRKN